MCVAPKASALVELAAFREDGADGVEFTDGVILFFAFSKGLVERLDDRTVEWSAEELFLAADGYVLRHIRGKLR